MPAGGLVTGSGETSRRIASAISNMALPTRNADCPNAASLAVAKTMLAIGRHRGVPHGEEIDQRCGGIDQGVDEARQQRDRPRPDPGGEFGDDQHHRDRQRGPGRAQPQAL